MFGTVAFAPRSLEEFSPIIGERAVAELRSRAAPLQGLRVLNLSMTGYGTSLTDWLAVQTPLLHDLGIDAQWQTLRASEEFTQANRTMYAGLGGASVVWSERLHETWASYIQANVDLCIEPYDVVVVHDPQPAPIVLGGREKLPGARWIWHCHLDLSGARSNVWDELAPAVAQYDAVLFDDPNFIPPGFAHPALQILPPGIDPLGPRCMPVSESMAGDLLSRYGLDPARPLIAQTGPLEPESDALGAIEVYDALRDRFPDLQLLLVATYLAETEETRAYAQQVSDEAAARPGVTLLLTDIHEIGNVELNIFQRKSNVILHKALRRGFGLWIAEAMWKDRPVVAGRHGGLPTQIEDGVTGYLVGSTKEAADRIGALLGDPALAQQMGEAGRERVRANFLVTHTVEGYLRLLSALGARQVPV